MLILNEEYKNTEEYLRFYKTNQKPQDKQELYDLMRLER